MLKQKIREAYQGYSKAHVMQVLWELAEEMEQKFINDNKEKKSRS